MTFNYGNLRKIIEVASILAVVFGLWCLHPAFAIIATGLVRARHRLDYGAGRELTMTLIDMIVSKRARQSSPSPIRRPRYSQYSVPNTKVHVDHDTAMAYAAVFSCAEVLGSSIAQLPKRVVQESPDGERTVLRNHPLAQMFSNGPNDEMTSTQFFEYGTMTSANWGNFYAEISEKQPMRLNVLDPRRVEVTRDQAGTLYYDYSQPQGSTIRFDKNKIVHVKTPTSDGIVGRSLIQLARENIGLGLGMTRYSGSQFGNNTAPGMILEHPNALGPEGQDNLRRSLESRHRGVDKAFTPLILEEGMKASTISVPSKDAQFIETSGVNVLDICRFYRVPPHLIFDLTRATFANIEHLFIEFVRTTVNSWVCRWTSELHRKLLTGQSNLIIEFDTSRLQMGDSATVSQVLERQVQNAIITVNEARAQIGMNPVEDGDRRMVNSAMVFVDTLDDDKPDDDVGAVPAAPDDVGATPEPEPPDDADDEERARVTAAPVLLSSIGALVSRETDQLARRIKTTDTEERAAKVAAVYDKLLPAVVDAFDLAFGVFESLTGVDLDTQRAADEYVKAHRSAAVDAARAGTLETLIHAIRDTRADQVVSMYFGAKNGT